MTTLYVLLLVNKHDECGDGRGGLEGELFKHARRKSGQMRDWHTAITLTCNTHLLVNR